MLSLPKKTNWQQKKGKEKKTFSLFVVFGEKEKKTKTKKEKTKMEIEEHNETGVETFDLEKEIEVEEIVSYLDKSSLVGRQVVATINGVYPSNFDKKGFNVGLIIDGKEYRLGLTRLNTNFLVSTFGKKPKDWLHKTMFVTAVDLGVKDVNGQQKQSYSVDFLKI